MKKIILLLLIIGYTNLQAQTDYTFIYDNNSIIEKGKSLHDKGNFDEAIKEYARIDKLDPMFLTAQYETALSMTSLKKIKELRELYEDLYKREKMPELPTLYTLYGSFLSDEKEFDASEKIFKEGEKYLSNSSNFLYNFALLRIRKKETQESINILERIISNDPNHASSHYLLGLLAFENGKIVEGTLALLGYLVIAPNGQFAEKAIVSLNQKYGQNYLEKSTLVFSKSGDQFEELETILRNQLPLKSAYKLKSKIDDIITRQVQTVAEYTTDHKMGDGFFETTYIPWIKDIVQKNYLEGFSYYILLSLEDKLGKQLTSQKKKITAFYDDYLLKDFWKLFAKRNQNIFGKDEDVVITYKKNVPYLIGPQIDGKSEGKYKYLNEYGNLGGEINFKNNLLNGYQKYFDDKGNLTEEKTFIDGKLNGVRTMYYSNGMKSFTETYKDDLLNGLVTGYYINGGKKYDINFVNDKRDGKQLGYYVNGVIKSETNYKNGDFDGLYLRYNEVGDLIESCKYVNNLLEGPYLEYFDGKTLKTEANYVAGKIVGVSKTYFSNKVIEKESTYEAGLVKKSSTYYANGKKEDEYNYNSKGDLESILSYDSAGNNYFEEKYKAGEIKSGLQYLRNNTKPVEFSASKNPFTIANFDNMKMVSGLFEKGIKHKEWNYYYASGNLKSKELYNKGQMNGTSYSYYNNGNLKSIRQYVNDTLNGVYEVYEKGKLNQVYHYSGGTQNGPYKTYYPDGSINTTGYLEKDKLNFICLSHWQNGTVSCEETFNEGTLLKAQFFNTNGEKELLVDYKNRTGKFENSYYKGAYSLSLEMINGVKNGKVSMKDKMNTPIYDADYINGLLHNAYKSYGPLGNIQIDRTYYSGVVNGINKEYDLVGNLRLVDENFFGDNHGKTTRYYHNKSKYFEYNEIEGNYDGDFIYYNQSGLAILIIEFQNGNVVSYTTLDMNNELKNKTVVEKENASIISKYGNGKIAMKINYDKGNLNGTTNIYNLEGKLEFESTSKNGVLNGSRIEYYQNGKPYRKENFVNNLFEGTQEYFKEDGELWLSSEYKNDELHGKTLIYDNGKLILTKTYNSNELVEIIK